MGLVSTKVGLDLSKHRNVARGGLLICIYYDLTYKSYDNLNLLTGWKVGFYASVVWTKGGLESLG